MGMYARKNALDRMQNILARRPHSESELRRKLSRYHSVEEVQDAIVRAKDYGWLANEDELSVRVCEELHRKRKGFFFIQKFLKEKGLPEVQMDSEVELEKARALIETLRRRGATDRQTLGRKLQARGFQIDIIREVLNEKS